MQLFLKVKRSKELLDEGERGELYSWLEFNMQKAQIMASGCNTSWQIEGEKVKASGRFYFLKLQNHCIQ